jgi:O-antigen polymerase
MKAHQQYSTSYLCSIAFLFLAAMHYYQVDGGGFGLSLSYNSTAWIAVSIIIAIGCWKSAASQILRWTRVDLALLLVFVVLLLPLLWSESPWRETTYDRYLGIAAFLMVVFVHRQFSLTEAQKQMFWAIIAAAALMQGVLGIVQFIAPEYFHFVKNGRPVGTLLQANVYASFLATGLAISLYQILAVNLSQGFKVLHYLVVFVCVLIEYVVRSRTGMLGAAFVVLFMFFLYRTQVKKIQALTLLMIIAVATAMAIAAIPQLLSPNDAATYKRENISSAGARSIMYPLSLDIMKEAPLMGHGLGKFSTLYMDKQHTFFAENPSQIESSMLLNHPHNELLLWGIEAGLFIVVLLIVFVVWLSWQIWRKGSLPNKSAWVCLLPIALHTQTELPFYTSAPHLILFAVLLAESAPGKAYSIANSLGFLTKSLAGLLVVLTSIFMITNLYTTVLLVRYNTTKNPADLVAVINPMAQQPILLLRRVELLMQTATPEAFDLVESIAKRELMVIPSDIMYFFLYKAQSRNGRQSEAIITKARGQQLFPHSVLFKSANPFKPKTVLKAIPKDKVRP